MCNFPLLMSYNGVTKYKTMVECINNRYSKCDDKCPICKGTREMSYLCGLQFTMSIVYKSTLKLGQRSLMYSNEVVTPYIIFYKFRNAIEEYTKENKLPSNYFTFNQNWIKGEEYTFEKVFNSLRQTTYVKGEKVKVMINNIRNDNKNEWRDAVVTESKMITPDKGRPYPFIVVDVIRTYCKGEWNEKTMQNDLTFYDKLNNEGFVNMTHIKARM